MSYELRILREKHSTAVIGRVTCEAMERAGTTVEKLQYRTYGEIIPKLETGSHLCEKIYGWSEWKDIPIVEDNK